MALLVVVFLISLGKVRSGDSLQNAAQALSPLHTPFQPTSWSLGHPDERVISFEEYQDSDPNRPNEILRKLYLQPIGVDADSIGPLLTSIASAMEAAFGAPVSLLPDIGLEKIPESAQRGHPKWGDSQLLTTYLLNEVLHPRRPKDAIAVLGLTTMDLWPGQNWNFVFGQASFRDRVGIWSIYRYEARNAKFPTPLRLRRERALKIALHETGHMYGITHCLSFQCLMNGTNSLYETDHAPLRFCPECLHKLWWATGVAPLDWAQKMMRYTERYDFPEESVYYEKVVKILEGINQEKK